MMRTWQAHFEYLNVSQRTNLRDLVISYALIETVLCVVITIPINLSEYSMKQQMPGFKSFWHFIISLVSSVISIGFDIKLLSRHRVAMLEYCEISNLYQVIITVLIAQWKKLFNTYVFSETALVTPSFSSPAEFRGITFCGSGIIFHQMLQCPSVIHATDIHDILLVK